MNKFYRRRSEFGPLLRQNRVRAAEKALWPGGFRLQCACIFTNAFLRVQESSLDHESRSLSAILQYSMEPAVAPAQDHINSAWMPDGRRSVLCPVLPFKDARMRFSREVSPGKMTATRALHVRVFTSAFRHMLQSGMAAFQTIQPLMSESSAAPAPSGPSWRLAPALPRNVLRDFHDNQNADRRHPPGRDPGGRHQR